MCNEDAREKQDAQSSDLLENDTPEGKHSFPPFPEIAGVREHHFFPMPNTPPFGETLAIYLLSGVLLVVLGSTLQYLHLFSGLFISQIAFIVGPAYLYTVFREYDVSRTFSLTPIGMKTALLAILIACSAFVLVGVVALLQELLLPRSPEYAADWEEIMLKFQQAPLMLTLFIISFLPGVCEEFLFRGFLLQGMRKKMADMPAVILVGVLFGLFHLDIYRFLPVSLLGILFGYTVVKTGSIFPAMVAHSVNNAISMLLSYGSSQVQEAGQLAEPSQLEALLSVESVLSIVVVVLVAAFVLGISLRALPEAGEARVDRPRLLDR